MSASPTDDSQLPHDAYAALRMPEFRRFWAGTFLAILGTFISVSNELGEFESGTVAHLFERPGDPAWGPTVSVVSGGLGTMLVVVLTAWLFPTLPPPTTGR